VNFADLELYLRLKAQVDAIVAGGGITLGATGAAPNANAATLTGSVLNLEPGSAIFKGVVSATEANGLSITGGNLAQALASSSVAGAMSAFHKENLDSLAFVSLAGGGVTADIIAAISEASGLGYKRVHLGDGTWVINCGALQTDAALITVPDGFHITGNGYGRTIISVVNTSTGAGQYGVEVFRTAVSSNGQVFRGLHFVGDNGTSIGTFTAQDQNQNACIGTANVGTSDVLIEDCCFEFLWGFSCHDRNDANTNVSTRGNRYFCNANGCNINASNSQHTLGQFYVSEGYECSGGGVLISQNVMRSILGPAITIGGNQSGSWFEGSVVSLNTIEIATGAGITVTDGIRAAVVSGNVVSQCALGALILHGAVNPPERINITGNLFFSNCLSPGVNQVGIDLRDSTVGGHSITGNQCYDAGIAGYGQNYAVSVAVPSVKLFGNFLGGATIDVQFTTGATGTTEAGNTYEHNTQQWLSTSVRSAEVHTTKASTDVILRSRVYNLSTLEARAYFSLDASGLMRWGDNLATLVAEGVNLYRNATGVLKTDASFVAVGTVTGSNLSGTNTGNVTLATVGAVPAAAGASLSGQILTLQPANLTNGGVVSLLAQTLGDGIKTLKGLIASTVATVAGVTVTDTTNTADLLSVIGTASGTSLQYGATIVGRDTASYGSSLPSFSLGTGAQIVRLISKNAGAGNAPCVAIGDGTSVGGVLEFQNFRWVKDNGTTTGLGIYTPNSGSSAAVARLTVTGNAATADAVFQNVNVGIGGTPATILHTQHGNAADVAARLESTRASYAFGVATQFKTPTKQFDMGLLGTSNGTTAVANGLYVYDATAGAFRFAITTSGRILIGTTTDDGSTTFQINGTASITGGAVLSVTNTLSGITNKTFSSLTHSGTMALGTTTISGTPNFSGAATMGAVALLSQTNTVAAITNKEFTNPTINAATVSGTLAGAATHSGNLTLSGANTYSGLSTRTSGVVPSQRSTTATTVTMATTDEIILADAGLGAVTLNLQAAATANKRKLTVVKTDAGGNPVTLTASGAETINGVGTLGLAVQYDRATIVSDGTTWFRVD
jgi:hypothetical protein